MFGELEEAEGGGGGGIEFPECQLKLAELIEPNPGGNLNQLFFPPQHTRPIIGPSSAYQVGS